MNIEIVTKHVDNETAIKGYIQDKVHSAIDRINARIDQVTVRLEDESANSDAFDGLCQIDVSLNPTGHIHVSAHGESPHDTVLQATRKMEHAIKHDIDRHRRSSRVRHQKSKQEFYASLEQTELNSTDEIAASANENQDN